MTINVMKEYLKIVQEELTTYMKLIFDGARYEYIADGRAKW